MGSSGGWGSSVKGTSGKFLKTLKYSNHREILFSFVCTLCRWFKLLWSLYWKQARGKPGRTAWGWLHRGLWHRFLVLFPQCALDTPGVVESLRVEQGWWEEVIQNDVVLQIVFLSKIHPEIFSASHSIVYQWRNILFPLSNVVFC